MSNRILKAGVIGVGHLGRHHARIYHGLENVELIGIADINKDARDRITSQFHCEGFTQFEDLIPKVDLVSVAVPTTEHFKVASRCLEAGIHVLVEKPITSTVEEGKTLVNLANAKNVILMVGQSERFNPAVSAASEIVSDPKFIEVHRLGPFSSRATDVDVVLDLMIHDIDLILSWVKSDVAEIRASGVPVLTNRIDIANARIAFSTGCIANLTASRISIQATRKVRVFQENRYLSIDCMAQTINCYRRKDGEIPSDNPMSAIEPIFFNIEKIEPLVAELSSFVTSICKSCRPPVSGEAGLNALEVCTQISHIIKCR